MISHIRITKESKLKNCPIRACVFVYLISLSQTGEFLKIICSLKYMFRVILFSERVKNWLTGPLFPMYAVYFTASWVSAAQFHRMKEKKTFMSPSFLPFIHPFTHTHPSFICPSICPHTHQSFRSSIHPSILPPTHLSIHSHHPFVHSSTNPFVI